MNRLPASIEPGKMMIILLVAGCCHAVAASVQPCPAECVCEPNGTSCVFANDSQLPDLPSNVTNLSLSGYNLTGLGRLGHLQLTALSISSSSLADASAEHLGAFTNLTSLVLSGNRPLAALPPRLFAALAHLARLDLSANSLNSVDADSLFGLDGLVGLDLSRNRIGRIDPSAFRPLVRLEELDLSGNLLTNLSASWSEPLTNLKSLRLADNRLSGLHDLRTLPNLLVLDLSRNQIARFADRAFDPLTQLRSVNLSANRFSDLRLSANTALRSVALSELANLTSLTSDALQRLDLLTELTITRNPSLRFIHPDAFASLKSLRRLDLSDNNLTALHKRTLTPLAALEDLSLSDNPWTCDCRTSWLSSWLARTSVRLSRPERTKCDRSEPLVGDRATNANCSGSRILERGAEVVTRLGASALLECRAVGNPTSSLTWILPRNHQIFHSFPPGSPVQWHFPFQPDHPPVHDARNVSSSSGGFARRIRVLRDGNLFISRVRNVDAGTYTCLASNALANDTARVLLTLNYQILVHVKVMSVLVGLATSIAALLVLLVFQLVRMAINRWGCCCCDQLVSPKAKQIRKMLETVETYKSQQLERLRENYAMQVNRIKDNCAQQLERIRDSYGTRVDRLRDICDFGTQQIDKVRDQYYEQVKKVRDYSSGQVSKVRENYVFQRNRIRKFSAHQMIRFRENYKVQQLHLNKILETLNIESCRTGCSRSESIDFGTDPVPVVLPLPLPLPLPPFFPAVHSLSDNQSDYFTPNDSGNPSRTPSEQFSCPSSPAERPRDVIALPDTCSVQIELEEPKNVEFVHETDSRTPSEQFSCPSSPAERPRDVIALPDDCSVQIELEEPKNVELVRETDSRETRV